MKRRKLTRIHASHFSKHYLIYISYDEGTMPEEVLSEDFQLNMRFDEMKLTIYIHAFFAFVKNSSL